MQAHTFSVAARCRRTGMLGVALASRFLAVGALCAYASPRVGAIATQALVNPLLGIDGLKLLAQGLAADDVVERVLMGDRGASLRQFAVVDGLGRAAAHTGGDCVPWAGHRVGSGFAVAGNMLTGPEVVEAMAAAYVQGEALPFPERLLRCLEAGEAAGGDRRGKQSASIYVVDREEYPFLSLRVDDHPEPLAELRRLYALSEQLLTPYRAMTPTRANPSGVTDPSAVAAARAGIDAVQASLRQRRVDSNA